MSSLSGRTGRGVRVAIVDSGIHAAHPHVQSIAGGVAFDAEGRISDDFIDRMGHGTAVAAAIREKAPDADLVAIKVFDRTLVATGRALVAAIRWAADQRVPLVNLSLGTTNPDHEDELGAAVEEAAAAGTIVVAAAPQKDRRWLPGALESVIAVEIDETIPRDACRVVRETGGGARLAASQFPRPIPGIPAERNVQGPSFAVANATGLLALALEDGPVRSIAELISRLKALQY